MKGDKRGDIFSDGQVKQVFFFCYCSFLEQEGEKKVSRLRQLAMMVADEQMVAQPDVDSVFIPSSKDTGVERRGWSGGEREREWRVRRKNLEMQDVQQQQW